MSVLLEMGTDHPVGQACVRHLANIEASSRVARPRPDWPIPGTSRSRFTS